MKDSVYKDLAKRIEIMANQAVQKSGKVSLSQAYNMLAVANGHRDWMTMRAMTGRSKRSGAGTLDNDNKAVIETSSFLPSNGASILRTFPDKKLPLTSSFGITLDDKIIDFTQDNVFLETRPYKQIEISKEFLDYITADGWGQLHDGSLKILYMDKPIDEKLIFKTVYLRDGHIESWNNIVLNDFNASKSHLKHIGSHARFDGNVYISHCSIDVWGHNVGGNFFADCSSLAKIKSDVRLDGDVYVRETDIKEWHHDVFGNFYAHYFPERTSDGQLSYYYPINNGLEYINPVVKFHGNVNVVGCPIREWSSDVEGYLLASKTKIEKFRNGTILRKGLSIEGAPVRNFNGLSVGGFLNVDPEQAKFIPDKFKDIMDIRKYF